MRSPIEVLSSLPGHDETLCGLIKSRVRQDRDHPFVTFGDAIWRRAGFHDITARVACMPASRGIGKGDRVAIMAPNSDAYVIVFFAPARIGAILVPVSPDFGVTEVSYIRGHAGRISCWQPKVLSSAYICSPKIACFACCRYFI